MDGVPYQVIRPHVDLTFPFVDLSDLPETDREPRAMAMATVDARELFDLERGPLVRGRLVRLSETDHRLYLVLHHIVFDGVALRLFLDDFVRAYADLAAAVRRRSPEPASPYAHYACWERQSVTPEVLESRLAYWPRAAGRYRSGRAPRRPSGARPSARVRGWSACSSTRQPRRG